MEVNVRKKQEDSKIYTWDEILKEEGIYSPVGDDVYIIVLKGFTTDRTEVLYHRNNILEPAFGWVDHKFTKLNKSLNIEIV